MASVKCPKCGEKVKVREGAERLRCRECGKSFAPPEDEDEDEDEREEAEEEEEKPAPKRSRKKPPAKKLSGTKIAAIVMGGLLALGVVALVVILIVRKGGKDGALAPADQAKVTADNFRSVKPGMDLSEVEGILGGGRSSSENDMRDAFRKGLGEIEAAMEAGFARFGEGAEWRRWDGKSFRVWVAFGKTKEGQRAAFSTALEQNGSTYTRHEGFTTFAGPLGHDLDELAAQRKKEDAIRNDTKWVRGAQAQNLLFGEWRNDQANSFVFAAGGKLTEDNPVAFPRQPGKEPTFRVLDDKHIEITYPSLFTVPPGQPSPFTPKDTVRKYEYLVNQDELALIEVTPHATLAGLALRTFYRMPAKAGSVAYTKLIAPALNDVRGNTAARQSALYKLRRLGKGAAVAVPELRDFAQKTTNLQIRREVEDVIRVLEGKP